MKTKFYTFNQNNSGGSFQYNKRAGITHYVIIEAVDCNHAISRAESIGLYFDGVEEQRDCPSCGDRWYKPYADEGRSEPMIYDAPVATHKRSEYGFFKDDQKEIAVHYLDGCVEWFC